jgi:dihydroorotate dehydrogenase
MSLQARYETFAGEGLKSVAEASLHSLGELAIGRKLLETYAAGPRGRIEDERLGTEVAGIAFENPLIVGAGWDKKGRALAGLYQLGFAGAEVGTVLPFAQPGNPKPRLWTIDADHGVGLNRLGFNSPGMAVVKANLEAAGPLAFPIGLNVGRNKDTPNEQAAEAHAAVIAELGHFASYVTLGLSSPNSPGLRELQEPKYLEHLIVTAREAMSAPKPLFIKIDGDRADKEILNGVSLLAEMGVDGIVAINTSTNAAWKGRYGRRWEQESGGLSGNDSAYRSRANQVIRLIYEEYGNDLEIIGVGGVGNTSHLMDKMCAGASAIQIVTAIRPSWGRVAARINRELLATLEKYQMTSVKELIGVQTKRGLKPVMD